MIALSIVLLLIGIIPALVLSAITYWEANRKRPSILMPLAALGSITAWIIWAVGLWAVLR